MYISMQLITINDFRDNVPVMNIQTWPLDGALYEGEATAGLIPTYFSEDPVAAKEAIATNIPRSHKDYQRLTKAFFMPETIGQAEALQIVRKPRYK